MTINIVRLQLEKTQIWYIYETARITQRLLPTLFFFNNVNMMYIVVFIIYYGVILYIGWVDNVPEYLY